MRLCHLSQRERSSHWERELPGLDQMTSIAPDDVSNHYGWIGTFFGMDLSASCIATQELLGWTPTGPTLIEDIDAGAYTSP